MTPDQLRSTLSRLDLSQVQAGRLLGYDDGGRAVRRWLAGEYRVPRPIVTLLRLMLEQKITVEDIKRFS